MSSSANPQHEPTMEEILASIRKIISEDQPPEPAKPAAKLAPVKAQPPPEPVPVRALVPVAAPSPPAAELDVLELTEEVPDEEPLAPAAAPAAPLENDIAFETIAPPPAEEPAMDDDLISDSTRHAVGRAFANLNGETTEFVPKGGGIEAIFVRAVQDALQPQLQHWIDSHSTDIMDNLKPLIRAWMDEHLPTLIEAAVAKEIARSADLARKR